MPTAHISRIDKPQPRNGGATHGWQVRVGPKRGYHSALFSDSVFGGCEQARRAAEEYLEQYLTERPKLADAITKNRERPYHTGKLDRRNKSGVTGVARRFKRWKGGGGRYWTATFKNLAGRPASKSWRIEVLGEQEARELAIEFRRGWEQAVDQGRDALEKFFNQWED
ncbi:MAG: hypothetical protein FOGNACKC_02215 [Anaerolineae bacterium]|nr:hypothetical protein [Anaerolineae bacterium]